MYDYVHDSSPLFFRDLFLGKEEGSILDWKKTNFHLSVRQLTIQIQWQNLKIFYRKIRTTFFIDNCVWILVPNSKQDMHDAYCAQLTSPQTSPVFTVLLLEPFWNHRCIWTRIFWSFYYLRSMFNKIYRLVAIWLFCLTLLLSKYS